MNAIPLFWYTNKAAVTSCENDLLENDIMLVASEHAIRDELNDFASYVF